MPSYEVKLTNQTGLTLKKGHNMMVVEAADAADAAQTAASHFGGDTSWANATVTEVAAAADMSPQVDGDGITVPFKLRIVITGADLNQTFEYEAIAADDVNAIGDAIVLVLNADAAIAGAAYSTPNLTIAETTDTLGDHTATVELSRNGAVIAGFVGAITDGGVDSAALSVALVPANTPCKVQGSARI
jgi:hypothetical protein